jgi:predicted nucleotidyltransferase
MSEEQNGKKDANAFYREALEILTEEKIPFILSGAFALRYYTGIYRDTKDMDVFCRPADHIRILKLFADKGYHTELTDARWLAKVFKGENFIDVIFDSVNNIWQIKPTWFERASEGELFGVNVKFIPPEELIWCKIYVQNRERYDGADLNHIILKCGKELDWERLYKYMDRHWQLLLGQIINFQFVYPAERDIIPRWLFDNLIKRAAEQYDHPASLEKVCQGPIIDQTQYRVDITDWGYKALTIKTI